MNTPSIQDIAPAVKADTTTRLNGLKALLRGIDTSALTTPEVVDLCERAAPGCTVTEILEALRQVAAEHRQHAAELASYAAGRIGS
jgi:hypothetical protein